MTEDQRNAEDGSITVSGPQFRVLEAFMLELDMDLRELLEPGPPGTAEELDALVDELVQRIELARYEPGGGQAN